MVSRYSDDGSRYASLRDRLIATLSREDGLIGKLASGIRHQVRGAAREWGPILHDEAAALILGFGEGPGVRRLDAPRAILRWYIRDKIGLEELFLQLYFGNLSLAEIESVTSQLWGDVGGAALIREVVPGIIKRLTDWLGRPIRNEFPYVILQGVDLRYRSNSLLSGLRSVAAVGVSLRGYREVLGIAVGPIGSAEAWDGLFAGLQARGMAPPRLVAGEPDGIVRALIERRWDCCATPTLDSDLEEILLKAVRPSDFRRVNDCLVQLKTCLTRGGVERIGRLMKVCLTDAGYSVSPALIDRLRRYASALDLPANHRNSLRRVSLVPAELNRVREQARTLGTLNDEKVILLFAAAAFRRSCRGNWNSKPFMAFGAGDRSPVLPGKNRRHVSIATQYQ